MTYKFNKQQKIYPIELPCKKTMYDSAESAKEMIEYLKSQKRVKNELHYYTCMVCGKWHLTSK